MRAEYSYNAFGKMRMANTLPGADIADLVQINPLRCCGYYYDRIKFLHASNLQAVWLHAGIIRFADCRL